MFILLHNSVTGKEILVNMDTVTSFEDIETGTDIHFSNGGGVRVKEKLQFILAEYMSPKGGVDDPGNEDGV